MTKRIKSELKDQEWAEGLKKEEPKPLPLWHNTVSSVMGGGGNRIIC